MTVDELLAKYPYRPGTTHLDYPRGDISMIQCVDDDGYRRGLAGYYLACEQRWLREETSRRAQELRQKHQPQSREHVDHWSGT